MATVKTLTMFSPAQDGWAAQSGTFILNVVLPATAFIALNVLATNVGIAAPATTFSSTIGLPGEIVALSWVLALVIWGFVRWSVQPRGYAGRDAADWLAMLMAAGVAFPFMTLGFDFFWTSVAAFGLALLALGTLIRVGKVSIPMALLMSPSIIAVLLPALVGFTLLAMGWSPPFGATQAAEAPLATFED